MDRWWDAALDLVAGSACAGCDRPGRAWCGTCAGELVGFPFVAWPQPTPDGLVRPVAAVAYAGVPRRAVIAYKERGNRSLARPLGAALARAVDELIPVCDAPGRVALVPVPSRGSAIRERGYAATEDLTRSAARRLRTRVRGAIGGAPIEVVRALECRRETHDQAGLDARARADNLVGSMWCPSRSLRRLARRGGPALVVICDDILTTGATVREAQRALETVGVRPLGVAVVAATPRRREQAWDRRESL